jgi:AraC-like DNA-binding protein
MTLTSVALGDEAFAASRRWTRASALVVDEWLLERRPPADLTDQLVCTWRGDIGQASVPLPDECVDLYWVNGSVWVSGPETRSWPSVAFPMWPGTSAVGVRFRSGVAPSVLGVSASDLRDQRVALGALWPECRAREMAEQLSYAADDEDRAAQFENAARALVAQASDPDPIALEVSASLRSARPISARDLARAAGVSERQLHRRCSSAFGYGPALLVRISRLQRFLRLARVRAGPPRLADLAVAAGYADQPHLSREVRSLMGTTAAELVRRSQGCPIGSRQASMFDDTMLG